MIIKYLPLLLIWLALAILSSIEVLYKQRVVYENYNGMKGTVTWATFAPRSEIYLCGVRLEDGTYGEVNYGSSPVEKGDTFINRISYSPFFGMSGMAYCVVPNEGRVLLEMCYFLLVILPLVGGVIYGVGYLINLWIKNH